MGGSEKGSPFLCSGCSSVEQPGEDFRWLRALQGQFAIDQKTRHAVDAHSVGEAVLLAHPRNVGGAVQIGVQRAAFQADGPANGAELIQIADVAPLLKIGALHPFHHALLTAKLNGVVHQTVGSDGVWVVVHTVELKGHSF